MASEVDLKDSERIAGIAMSFPVNDSPSSAASSPKVPRRLRRRLVASKSPTTAEEIEARLREADLRRQQFYEELSSKARPKQRCPSWSSPPQEEELGQRIEAKLNAAEQKRLSILAKAQMRLARLDELRQAAKSEVEMRFEKERDQLEMKVESRVQQAEANRLLILKTHRQLRALRKERTAQSLTRRMIQESKYKERVHAAIHQKRASAERKRLGILEAERSRARARLMRVQRVANSVYTQRETERMKMKDRLEDRLQRAKRQRAEYLRHRRRSYSSPSANMKLMHEQDEDAELLTQKLARYWRQFIKSKGTTYSLAKAYIALNINEESVKSMPFEQLALQIESDATLQSVKALLDRFETRLTIQEATCNGSSSRVENIDHLLKRVSTPRRRGNISNSSKKIEAKRRGGDGRKGTQNRQKPSRYPVRIMLCAYMIFGHPDAVLSRKGKHENALAESAAKFIQEFESLIKIVLWGRNLSSQSEMSSSVEGPATFRSQLEAFDKSWCSYLYFFVVWKVKDAKLLEEDLVRVACQLELSMMHTCKLTSEGRDQGSLTHDMEAIQKQVMEDQKLLKAKVQNLTGDAGIERMKCALSDVRSELFASKEPGSPLTSPMAHISSPALSGSEDGSPISISNNISNQAIGSGRLSHIARSLFKDDDPSASKKVGAPIPSACGEDGQLRSELFASMGAGSPLTSPVAHISSPALSGSEDGSPISISNNVSNQAIGSERLSHIARSLFKDDDPSASKKVGAPIPSACGEDGQLSIDAMVVTENELLVNEIVHESGRGFSDNLDIGDEDQSSVKAKVKETMEKAFWDGIMESVNREQPDFSWVLKLMTEIRDELCEMSPDSWRQEIFDIIDEDILSQVLRSGTVDMIYLGKILEFSLVTLEKLCAPANDDEMKANHRILMKELVEISRSGNNSGASFAITIIKGLRFVLQQIQILKREISRTRIRIMEPLIKGPAGFDYMREAFSNRYGPPSVSPTSLPLTAKWLSSVATNAEEEWSEYMHSLSSLATTQAVDHPQGFPSITLRTGGSPSGIARMHPPVPVASGNEQPESKGERMDLLIRLGLLKLVTEIEGLRPENLPETLKLNLSRLRTVQSQLQKIIVISTCTLVLRQTLLSENLVASPSGMENIISRSTKRLLELLDKDEGAGISEITEATIEFPDGIACLKSPENLQARKIVVANMIAKSLKPGMPYSHECPAHFTRPQGGPFWLGVEATVGYW
ncbi:hypothetical protein Nepgr_002189 [Nepenthes gracilis]|uniref:T-complex protein 11 n=1 Tax=Nepenthes gracilis TaxID=150966 RepID=A0AAD3RYA8_NEPGR|nr:hypothetical protein Nepgr_002189 [Nepenthes gracilis]